MARTYGWTHAKRKRFLLSPKSTDSLRGPPSLLFNGCWGGGDISLRVKRPGQESNHSSLCNAEIKNKWRCTSTPPCAFMACTVTTLRLPLLLFYSYFLSNTEINFIFVICPNPKFCVIFHNVCIFMVRSFSPLPDPQVGIPLVIDCL